MKVRAVTRADRPAMIQLFEDILLFTADERAVVLELLDVYLQFKEPQDYYFYVSEEAQQELSSFICFGPTPMTDGTYDMYWIGTHPKHTRQGLAQKLVHFMADFLKGRGGRLIRIETSGQDAYQGTVAFYKKVPFHEEARIRDFYRPGDDLIIYTYTIR